MMKFKVVGPRDVYHIIVDLTVEVNGEEQLHRIFVRADDAFTGGAVWMLGELEHAEQLWGELSRFFEGQGTIDDAENDIIINEGAFWGE